MCKVKGVELHPTVEFPYIGIFKLLALDHGSIKHGRSLVTNRFLKSRPSTA